MVQKKLLVVGAGPGQVPAIEKAQLMGYQTLAIDQNPHAIGLNMADISEPIDITDIDAVVRFAAENEIDGAITLQSDIGIPTVGKINDELSLPGIGTKVSHRCSNKHLMQKTFDEYDVPSPESHLADSCGAAQSIAGEIGFPCLIKPLDSSGSRGVCKVEIPTEIEQAYEYAVSYSNQDRVIVEEYIEGVEAGAQAFSRNGSCELVFVHNDTVTGPPHFVPIGHSYPPKLDEETLIKAEQATRNGIEALGIHVGPSNIDFIIDEHGEPKILEIAARMGATCLPQLTTHFSGIDWVAESIRAAVGDTTSLDQSMSRPCAALVISSPSDGTLSKFHVPNEIKNWDNIIDLTIEASIGDEVSKLRDGPDRIGTIVVAGQSWRDAEKEAEGILEQITIEVE